MEALWFSGPAEFLVVAAVAASAGFLRGFSGFGAGLVMAPAFMYLMGPVRAVPLLVMLELFASLRLVPGAVGISRWELVIPLGVAACLAIPAGSLFLRQLEPTLLRRLVSFVVLVFVALLASGWRLHRRPGRFLSVVTGAASGLLTGAGGIGGPPVILFVLSGPDRAPHTRASIICYFAITQTIALITFAISGLLTSDVALLCLLLAPVFLVTIHMGSRFFDRSTETVYRNVALGFLAIVALSGLLLGSAGG